MVRSGAPRDGARAGMPGMRVTPQSGGADAGGV